VASRGGDLTRLTGLLGAPDQLLLLRRVRSTLPACHYIMNDPAHRVVTLLHVRQIFLSCSKGGDVEIHPILEVLKLPNLTSLAVDMTPIFSWSPPSLSPPLANTSRISFNSRKWEFTYAMNLAKSVSEVLPKQCWSMIGLLHDTLEKHPVTTIVNSGAASLFIPG